MLRLDVVAAKKDVIDFLEATWDFLETVAQTKQQEMADGTSQRPAAFQRV
jgi:hypothetical protein